MKKLLFLLSSVLLINCTPTTPGTQCSGGNEICFDFQGTNHSLNGYLSYGGTDYYRLIGSDGTTFIRIDIHDNTYTVASYVVYAFANPVKIEINSDIYYGANGTINITSVNNNLIFGTFNGNVKLNNYGALIPFTNGIIDGIAF